MREEACSASGGFPTAEEAVFLRRFGRHLSLHRRHRHQNLLRFALTLSGRRRQHRDLRQQVHERPPRIVLGPPTHLPTVGSEIVDNFDYGVSVAEIAEQFEVQPEHIKEIVAYAKSHRVTHPV